MHSDIKPDNILYSEVERSYMLIDFGLSCLLDSQEDHLKPTTSKCLGFSSLNKMMGGQVSFIDDWVCLLYSLINLLKGSLPWINKQHVSKEAYLKQNLAMKEDPQIILDYISDARC